MSTNRTSRTRSTRRVVGTMALAAALVGGVATAVPASALTVKTGYGKIDGAGLELGKNIDLVTGDPAANAKFTWDLNTATGSVAVNVDGVFAVMGRSGVPVRLQLKYYDGVGGTGNVVGATRIFVSTTPANDLLTLRTVNWTPAGGVGIQSAKVSVASDADRNGVWTLERTLLTTL